MERIIEKVKDIFEYAEIRQMKEIQKFNFSKYKKSFCDLDCNKIRFYIFLQNLDFKYFYRFINRAL